MTRQTPPPNIPGKNARWSGPASRPLQRFKAGNPGRPKGRVREDRPHEYFKVVASLLSKQLDVQVGEYEHLSDDELRIELIKDLMGLDPKVLKHGK